MKLFYTLLIVFTASSASAAGWIQQTDFGGTARHRTTMLGLGNKIYAGLGHYNGTGLNVLFEDWWEFDPATSAWTQKANYGGGLCYHSAAFSIDNIGYVGTGRIPSTALVQDFYKYDPATNMWTQIADFPGIGRRGAVAFAINDYGYVGAGTSSSDFYRYTPSNNSWIQIASLPGGARMSAVAFSIGGYGYAGTGEAGGWSTAEFYKYNPALNTWTQIQDVGDDPLEGLITRMEASAFELGGKGYVLTGVSISSGTSYKDMWELDPTTDTWTRIDDFDGTARRYLSATTMNGVAYVGLGTNGTNFKDFWKFDYSLALLEKNLDNISVSAYPNPSTDILIIDVDWAEEVPMEKMNLSLVSLTGQVVYSESLKANLNNIDVTSFKPGNYIYSIQYEDRIVKNGHVIVH
ncbi:MAG: T9SS type A sorting domain-containing protein [Crocinitomicaceae bacterium]|nr:T9SS type A sorting domain-containing protein [Crocinitomicaceae bacterium]